MNTLRAVHILTLATALAGCCFDVPENGQVTISARVQSASFQQVPGSARTILPAISPASYRVSFTGPSTVEPEMLNAQGSGSFVLPFGTWTLTADGLDAVGTIVASGTSTEFTLSVQNPTEDVPVSVLALATGTGQVDLSLTWPAGLVPEVTTAEVLRDGVAVPAGTLTLDLASDPRSVRYQESLAAGSYRLSITLRASTEERYVYDEALQVAGNATSAKTVALSAANFDATARFVADHEVATDAVLRTIPTTYIDAARNNLHIAYFHSSHGTHVSYGAFGLPGFKSGDATRFAVTTGSDTGMLELRDYFSVGAPIDISTGVDDLDVNGDPAFVVRTRTYLDDSANAGINVVMWSWCDITGHIVQNYLDGMSRLIAEYGPGGTRQRPTPVTFIFMTGHANLDANTGAGNPKSQAQLILDYCKAHGQYCIDYYNIDTHDMTGVYHEDAGDDGNLPSGDNYYLTWQNSHTLGVDWYNNREYPYPDGDVAVGVHNTQHITANRKAFALWYILTRIAGWSGS